MDATPAEDPTDSDAQLKEHTDVYHAVASAELQTKLPDKHPARISAGMKPVRLKYPEGHVRDHRWKIDIATRRELSTKKVKISALEEIIQAKFRALTADFRKEQRRADFKLLAKKEIARDNHNHQRVIRSLFKPVVEQARPQHRQRHQVSMQPAAGCTDAEIRILMLKKSRPISSALQTPPLLTAFFCVVAYTVHARR